MLEMLSALGRVVRNVSIKLSSVITAADRESFCDKSERWSCFLVTEWRFGERLVLRLV